MTLSLDEAALVVDRYEPHITWGGCYFSVHSAVARHSKFRTRVPPERVMIESDHGYRDPPAAIPCRVELVEHLLGQQLRLGVKQVRRLAWRNLATIIRETGTRELFPETISTVLAEVSPDIEDHH